jgi:hypothetical protein
LKIRPGRIDAAELTTYDVDPGGMFVQLHVLDREGHAASVVLPIDCLRQLLMSLPGMVQQALRNRYGDDSLRVTYPLQDFRLELGGASAAGLQQLVLTLATTGGFSVSFSASEADMASLGGAIAKDVLPLPHREPSARRLS